jgi:hypothetical protein
VFIVLIIKVALLFSYDRELGFFFVWLLWTEFYWTSGLKGLFPSSDPKG